MSRSREELKKAAVAAIDRHRDEIIAYGEEVFAAPELGYKEVKSAAKFQAFLDSIGFEHKDNVAITGVLSTQKGRSSKLKVAVMGELDADRQRLVYEIIGDMQIFLTTCQPEAVAAEHGNCAVYHMEEGILTAQT